MNPLNAALSPAELDELDDFLASDDVPESAMDVSTLEGDKPPAKSNATGGPAAKWRKKG